METAAPAAPEVSTMSPPPNGAAKTGGAGKNGASPGKMGTAPGGVPPELPKSFKVKTRIDGKDEEREVSYDDLVASWQMRAASSKRFEEIQRERKETEAKLKELESLPKSFLENPVAQYMRANPGSTKKEALEWLAQHMDPLLNEETMDPKERQLRQREEELKIKQAELDRQQKEREQAEFEAEVGRQKDMLASKFEPALQKAGLPADPTTFAMMVQLYRHNRDLGLDLTPDEMAKSLVEKEVERQGALFDKMEGEQILQAFPILAKKVHKAIIDRYEKRSLGTSPERTSSVTQGEPKQPQRPKLVSDRDMNRRLGIVGF